MTSGKVKNPRTAINSFRVYKRQQAAISRRRLYPVTVFYSAYSLILLTVGLRTARPLMAIGFYLGGIPVWTLVEYLTHRYVLHKRFQVSKHRWKFYKKLANKYLDPLHWEHHERPFDGLHINGTLKDIIPLFAVAAPASFLFPIYTAPMMLAGIVQSYVIEEWIHHSVHFYNFRNPYFRYIRKHHIYHHTSSGMEKGFGFTSAFWDVIFRTRFPEPVRRRLYGRRLSLRVPRPRSERDDVPTPKS